MPVLCSHWILVTYLLVYSFTYLLIYLLTQIIILISDVFRGGQLRNSERFRTYWIRVKYSVFKTLLHAWNEIIWCRNNLYTSRSYRTLNSRIGLLVRLACTVRVCIAWNEAVIDWLDVSQHDESVPPEDHAGRRASVDVWRASYCSVAIQLSSLFVVQFSEVKQHLLIVRHRRRRLIALKL